MLLVSHNLQHDQIAFSALLPPPWSSSPQGARDRSFGCPPTRRTRKKVNQRKYPWLTIRSVLPAYQNAWPKPPEGQCMTIRILTECVHSCSLFRTLTARLLISSRRSSGDLLFPMSTSTHTWSRESSPARNADDHVRLTRKPIRLLRAWRIQGI